MKTDERPAREIPPAVFDDLLTRERSPLAELLQRPYTPRLKPFIAHSPADDPRMPSRLEIFEEIWAFTSTVEEAWEKKRVAFLEAGNVARAEREARKLAALRGTVAILPDLDIYVGSIFYRSPVPTTGRLYFKCAFIEPQYEIPTGPCVFFGGIEERGYLYRLAQRGFISPWKVVLN